ncbi:MAG: hypothetical protein H0T43_07380 [Solirubrobacterales bacterium]|nr:hypothetical protein [Solirubrobacterales bacterium]
MPLPDPPAPPAEPDPAPPTIHVPPAAGAPAPLDPERTVAILTDVLDDLGAAHHRPFSRG